MAGRGFGPDILASEPELGASSLPGCRLRVYGTEYFAFYPESTAEPVCFHEGREMNSREKERQEVSLATQTEGDGSSGVAVAMRTGGARERAGVRGVGRRGLGRIRRTRLSSGRCQG